MTCRTRKYDSTVRGLCATKRPLVGLCDVDRMGVPVRSQGVGSARSSLTGDAALLAEVLVLRQEYAVLRRQVAGAVRAGGPGVVRGLSALVLARGGVRCSRSRRRRCCPGSGGWCGQVHSTRRRRAVRRRPAVTSLILRMAGTTRSGVMSGCGGIDQVGSSNREVHYVADSPGRRGRPGAAPVRATWKQFLHAQARTIIATDFLHVGHGAAQEDLRVGVH